MCTVTWAVFESTQASCHVCHILRFNLHSVECRWSWEEKKKGEQEVWWRNPPLPPLIPSSHHALVKTRPWCLQRLCEERRNPSRVMVLLYALRAAIFYLYPSCLRHKLCNPGSDLLATGRYSQQTCGLHALFRKELGIFTLELVSLFSFLLLP